MKDQGIKRRTPSSFETNNEWKYTSTHLCGFMACCLIKYRNMFNMIYLLTAIGLTPGGSSTVYIYTQTIHRTTQNKQYIEQHKNLGRVQAVPRLCGLYPGIWLTTEEKARKNLSQGSRRVPAGTMKVHEHTIRIYRHKNKNT